MRRSLRLGDTGAGNCGAGPREGKGISDEVRTGGNRTAGCGRLGRLGGGAIGPVSASVGQGRVLALVLLRASEGLDWRTGGGGEAPAPRLRTLFAQAQCVARYTGQLTWRPPAGCARFSCFYVPRTFCCSLLLKPTRPILPARPSHLHGKRRTSAITTMPTWRDFWSSGRSVSPAYS